MHAPWDIVDAKELGKLLSADPGTVNVWRYRGVGPPYFRRGKKIQYEIADIIIWLGNEPTKSKVSVYRAYLEENGIENVSQLSDEKVFDIAEIMR